MVENLYQYLKDNFNFEKREDKCIKLLNNLSDYIANNFVEELSFDDAVELIGRSEILLNALQFLFSGGSQSLKDLYHNNLIIAALLMAYAEVFSLDLDEFIYGKKGSKNKVLSFEEVKSLMIRVKNGDLGARDILYNHNLGLVKKYANSYARKYNVEFEDLTQQGSIGLLTAIDRYDYTLGFKFSTYATWWIRQEINRYCEDNATTIRIPSNTRQVMNKVRIVRREVYEKTGIYPENSEVAKILGISETKVKDILEIRTDSTVSLEQKISDEKEGTELGDFIADETAYDPEEESVESLSKTKLLKVLDDVLTNREKQVILFRNGFYGRVYTLEEVGKIYGVTRERIRQIEAKALRKLRTPSVKNKLLADEDNSQVKKISNIKYYFPNHTLDELQYVVPNLPDNQATLVYRMFGKDLNDYYVLSNSEISMFIKTVIPNIKKIIRGERIVKSSAGILDHFAGYSIIDILDAVKKLPEKQSSLIYLRYGDNLDELNPLPMGEIRYISSTILFNIGKLLRGEELTKKNKTIYDWFSEYTKDAVNEAVCLLPEKEKYLVYLRFGKNLDEYNDDLTSDEATYLRSTIKNHIGKLLKGDSLEVKKITIFDWFPGYSKEEIKSAIDALPTKQKGVAYLRFGQNLDEWNNNLSALDSSYLRGTVKNNISKLLRGEKIDISASSLSLVELFSNYSKEQFNRAIFELSENERRLLHLKYGENFDEVISIPSEISSMVTSAKNRLKIIIDNLTEERKSLYEIIGLDKRVVDKRIRYLDREDIDDLYKYFAYDLENPGSIMLDESLTVKVERDIIPRLKRPTAYEKDFIHKIKLIADRIHNDNLLLSFTTEEIVVGYLLSIYSEYSDDDLSYILNLLSMSQDELSRMLKFMNRKKPDAYLYIGNIVTGYIVKQEKKNAVLS